MILERECGERKRTARGSGRSSGRRHPCVSLLLADACVGVLVEVSSRHVGRDLELSAFKARAGLKMISPFRVQSDQIEIWSLPSGRWHQPSQDIMVPEMTRFRNVDVTAPPGAGRRRCKARQSRAGPKRARTAGATNEFPWAQRARVVRPSSVFLPTTTHSFHTHPTFSHTRLIMPSGQSSPRARSPISPWLGARRFPCSCHLALLSLRGAPSPPSTPHLFPFKHASLHSDGLLLLFASQFVLAGW